jgi:hypothetical protein
MEVLESKKKQAAKNKMRKNKANAKELKDPLEKGDICTISTNDLKTKYFPYLPVLITGVIMGCHAIKYSVASRHGYLKGHFDRQDLKYREHLNAEIEHIDTEVDGFRQKLSLQEACDELAVGCICHCRGDCAKNSRCTCKSSGSFCTNLCHKGRGNNTKCTLLHELSSDDVTSND